MENFRELIDAFVKFYSSAEVPLKFGIILILCVVALMLLVYIPRSIVFLIQAIIARVTGKKKKKEEAPAEQASAPTGISVGGYNITAENERRTAQYFGEELRKFHSEIDSIQMEDLIEEQEVPHADYSTENLEGKSKFQLSEKQKLEIRQRFEGMNTKELKLQKAAHIKKTREASGIVSEANTTYRALLSSRETVEDQCTTLYERHLASLARAKECQEKVKDGRRDIGNELSATKEALDRGVVEKEKILLELEKNKQKNAENAEKGGKLVIAAQNFVTTTKREIIETGIQYRDDAAAYLSRRSELEEINKNLSESLDSYGKNLRQTVCCEYALTCIEERITAIQKALEEKKRREEEEAARIKKEQEEEKARIAREKAEKKAEEKRLAQEKAEAERKAREAAAREAAERAEAERARKEAEEKAEAERLAILQAQQEMNESNQRADSAASKAAELDNRAKALEEQEAAIEAEKLSLAEEKKREKAEKEQKKAAAKAERERKEAQEKAERAAREKAELEALEDLTEEEKEMRRKVEEANQEFNPRSSLAAEEGFVNEQRIAEIEESQRMLADEQAKRQAEKDARQKAVEKKHSKILENDAIIDDESMTPEERMEALRKQWREERENREKFEAEKSRRARETEQRRKELSSMNSEDQE